MFVFWTFTPFVTQRKRFYTVVMWSRLLMVLVGEWAGCGLQVDMAGGNCDAGR